MMNVKIVSVKPVDNNKFNNVEVHITTKCSCEDKFSITQNNLGINFIHSDCDCSTDKKAKKWTTYFLNLLQHGKIYYCAFDFVKRPLEYFIQDAIAIHCKVIYKNKKYDINIEYVYNNKVCIFCIKYNGGLVYIFTGSSTAIIKPYVLIIENEMQKYNIFIQKHLLRSRKIKHYIYNNILYNDIKDITIKTIYNDISTISRYIKIKIIHDDHTLIVSKDIFKNYIDTIDTEDKILKAKILLEGRDLLK